MRNFIFKKVVLILSFFAVVAYAGLIKADEKEGGAIYGDIRLDGAKPVKSAPAIVEYQGPCGTKRLTSVIKLWKERVMDVTLWLTTESGEVNSNQRIPANIIGRKCEFTPKMLPAVPGSSVKIFNKDQLAQWIIIEENSHKKEQEIMEPGGDPLELVVEKDISIHIASGFYPWMEAWIRPIENLLAYTATDWDGRFAFNNIPAGEYTLHAWHPVLGEILEEREVVEGDKAKVELHYAQQTEPIIILEASPLEEFLGKKEEAADENPFKKK
jgi:hypothetical protein